MEAKRRFSYLKIFLMGVLEILQSRAESNIGRKLLLYVLLLSSLFVVLQTAVQLKGDYDDGIAHIEDRFDQLYLSYEESLSRSIWNTNYEQVESTLNGMARLPDVVWVRVEELSGEDRQLIAEVTNPSEADRITHELPLIHRYDDEEEKIGTLTLSISLTTLYDNLLDKFTFIVLFQTIKTFTMSIFILAIFHYLVTRHLISMAKFARNLQLDNLNDRLELDRPTPSTDDELIAMERAINETKVNLKKLISYNEASIRLKAELQQKEEKELLQQQHSEDMERKNQELASQNQRLEEAFNELKNTQEQLLHSEKLAALGGMVKGVAHELNTPIGLSITGASHISQDTQRITRELSEGTMTKSNLDSYLETTANLTKSINISLDKAASLIKSFKMVSVEQHDEHVSEFDVGSNLEDILFSINHKLREHNIEIHNHVPSGIVFNSYPGVFYQIYTNLINNAVLHGFEGRESGNITIDASFEENQLTLKFSDDGIGMDEKTLNKLYEPFFTTKRANGGTGLGMNIIFNLIKDKLYGTINVTSEVGEGTHYTLVIPSMTDELQASKAEQIEPAVTEQTA